MLTKATQIIRYIFMTVNFRKPLYKCRKLCYTTQERTTMTADAFSEGFISHTPCSSVRPARTVSRGTHRPGYFGISSVFFCGWGVGFADRRGIMEEKE